VAERPVDVTSQATHLPNFGASCCEPLTSDSLARLHCLQSQRKLPPLSFRIASSRLYALSCPSEPCGTTPMTRRVSCNSLTSSSLRLRVVFVRPRYDAFQLLGLPIHRFLFKIISARPKCHWRRRVCNLWCLLHQRGPYLFLCPFYLAVV
jgi:hypothetical protein